MLFNNLNTLVPTAPALPVVPFVRPSTAEATTTIVADADTMAALTVAALLVDPLFTTWTFAGQTGHGTFSWQFCEIATVKNARVFDGTITSGQQIRRVRLIVMTNELIAQNPNFGAEAIELDISIVGTCLSLSPLQGLRRLFRAIFAQSLPVVECYGQIDLPFPRAA